MHKAIHILVVMLSLGITSQFAMAGSVTVPNTFTSGTSAVAAEVNDNFGAVKTAVDDNDTRIATLEASVATLQTGLAAANSNISTLQNDLNSANTTISALQTSLGTVEGNSVLALDGSLTYSVDANGYATALFSGINVQVINGVAQTTPNGLGNLIVGYNNRNIYFTNATMCSDGQYTDQTSCTNAGETWASNQKTGSHNLIVGDRHSYTRTGGIVFGYQNIIRGDYASISGGNNNNAYGLYSHISGGYRNITSGSYSNVSGGYANAASGLYSSISGGTDNTASGTYSTVSGGDTNTASGSSSNVSGGYNNTASGSGSSVSGGSTRSATGIYDWAAGSLFETQ